MSSQLKSLAVVAVTAFGFLSSTAFAEGTEAAAPAKTETKTMKKEHKMEHKKAKKDAKADAKKADAKKPATSPAPEAELEEAPAP